LLHHLNIIYLLNNHKKALNSKRAFFV